MNVWVALCHDRHKDPDAEVFVNKQDAIDHAWKYMRAHVASPDHLSEKDYGGNFWIEYEFEEDCATVFRKMLHR